MSQNGEPNPHDPAPPGVDLFALVRRVLRPIASLRLTVVLFVLALGLVFFGTVAQKQRETFAVVDQYFYSLVVWVPFQLFVEVGKVFLGLSPDAAVSGTFPFPGGKLLGWALFINLIAAHLVRFRISWKRAGILIIHTGLGVLLMGEFITREYAVESTMTIGEGERVNFVDHSRKVELAFVTPSEPTVEDAAVVPGSLLRQGGIIRHEELPVDVEVLEYHANSAPVEVGADDPDALPFTNVLDKQGWVKFAPAQEVSGTSSQANAPMVRVRLKYKGTGADLGTYSLSLWGYRNAGQRRSSITPRTVKVGAAEYTVELRPKRIYKPYSIELLKFEIDFYPGSEKERGFASEVKLLDPERGEDRQVRIWMNHPLRHRGETFYQHQFFMGGNGTVLQVVQNPGAVLPYISCSLISGGMLIHFGILLVGFLRRRAAA